MKVFLNDPLPLIFFPAKLRTFKNEFINCILGGLLELWKDWNIILWCLYISYIIYVCKLNFLKCYSRLRWYCPNNFLPRDIYLYACWVTKHIIWYKFIWSQTGMLCFVSEWSNNILGRSWISFGDLLMESKFLVYKLLQILWQCALFASALEICYNENCFH